MTTFMARWPITDETLGIAELAVLARPDLPLLTAQAGARITGPGRWFVVRSAELPGSGRITEWVLVYEAPAEPRPPRAPLALRGVPAASPYGEIDDVAVSRILSGDWRYPASEAERREVCRMWRDSGRPLAELERLTGWNVHRYIDAEKEEAA